MVSNSIFRMNLILGVKNERFEWERTPSGVMQVQQGESQQFLLIQAAPVSERTLGYPEKNQQDNCGLEIPAEKI